MKKKITPDARLPMYRMMVLHHEMLAKNYPNCRKLAEQLEVSSKTIQRDIEYMRDILSLPVEYNAIERGFYYDGEVQEFPTIQITEGEMAALFIARYVLEQYEGTALIKPLSQAFSKITGQLTDHINFQWEDLSEQITFKGTEVSGERILLFQELSQAVLQSKEIQFQYKGIRDQSYSDRTIHPYQQVCWNGSWYLLGWDKQRKDWRVFSLKRIRNLEVNPSTFQRDKKFNPALFWGESFGVYRGQKSELIRIRFHDWAARIAVETEWHGSQKLQSSTESEVILTWNMQITPDLLRWVLSWGSRAEVLEPKSLRDNVHEEAKKMLGR